MSAAIRRSILLIAIAAVSFAALAADAPQAWWPERAQFKPTDGSFREHLSPQGAYVYDASDARIILPPNINAPPDQKSIVAPTIEKYADGTVFATVPYGQQAAWTLGKIEPGKYWLGVQICCGDKRQPDWGQTNWYYVTRVNGMAYDFTWLTGPVDVGNDRYAGEMQSTGAIDLKSGDRVTVRPNSDQAFVGKLVLYKNQPKRGPIFRTPGYLTTGRREIWDSQIELHVNPPGKKSTADFFVRNTANADQTLHASLHVLNYFGDTVASKEWTLPLKDLELSKSQVEFDAGDSPRYRAVLTVRGADDLDKAVCAWANAEVAQGLQQTASLDGQWEQTVVPKSIELAASPAADAKWQPYWVPGMMQMGIFKDLPPGCKDSHIGWARRTFQVPDRMKGKRISLSFERLAEEAVVYVNGKKVGCHYGLYFPEEYDVTDALKPGDNELVIGFRDFIAYIDPATLKNADLSNAWACFSQSIAPALRTTTAKTACWATPGWSRAGTSP